MKTIIFTLSISTILLFSCKKEDVKPQTNTVTVHDTIIKTNTVTVHDTVDCSPKSDLIQGDWYCYKSSYDGIFTPSQKVIFTNTTLRWDAQFPTSQTISFTSDYSEVKDQQGNHYFTVARNGCDELKITNFNNITYFLRRNM